MSENFLIDNNFKNVKRLVQIGFKFNIACMFAMNGTLKKGKKSFYLYLFPLENFALLNDDTSDVNNPNFFSDTCRTWNELLDALVRRKAITQNAAQKIRDNYKGEDNE